MRLKVLFVIALIATSMISAPPDKASAQTVNNTYDIVMEASDQDGQLALLRRGYWDGLNGAGADKILRKHNIDNHNLFASTLLQPGGGIQEQPPSGTVYQYYQPIGRTECDWVVGPFGKGCETYEQDTIKLVVDYRPSSFPTENNTYGVVTMHCTKDGKIDCEPWVNSVIEYPAKGKWPYAIN